MEGAGLAGVPAILVYTGTLLFTETKCTYHTRSIMSNLSQAIEEYTGKKGGVAVSEGAFAYYTTTESSAVLAASALAEKHGWSMKQAVYVVLRALEKLRDQV